MGVCNKGAGILAPLIFSFFLIKPEDTITIEGIAVLPPDERKFFLNALLQRVVVPYACLGTLLLCMGSFVKYSPLPDIDYFTERTSKTAELKAGSGIWQFPHLILGAIAIFMHVGTHVIAIDTVIGYAGSMGISLTDARSLPSYTLLATMLGYLAGILLIPKYISQLRIFRICTLLGMALSSGILLVRAEVDLLGYHADISLWFVVLLGLANSLIWAGIWPLALDGLGKFTKLGASFLIMGLCGQAVMPLIYGLLADWFHHRFAYVVLIPCYAYLIFYAFYGYRLRSWKSGHKDTPLSDLQNTLSE